MEELDENVQNGLNKLEKRFHELQKLLNDLMGENELTAAQITDGMTAVEKAKYYGCVAYAMQTLYAVYLRLNNEETRKEESDAELVRIHGAILKIKNAISAQRESAGRAKGTEQEDDDEDKDEDIDIDIDHCIKDESKGPRMRVDIPAAQRFIAHNVDKDVRDKMHEKFGENMKAKKEGQNAKKKQGESNKDKEQKKKVTPKKKKKKKSPKRKNSKKK